MTVANDSVNLKNLKKLAVSLGDATIKGDHAFVSGPTAALCHPRSKARIHFCSILLSLSQPTALGGTAYF